VADNDDVHGISDGGSGDDVTSDDALDAARFDEEQFDDVTAALAGLSFLNPTSELSDPMPEAVWERLSRAMATEASARSASQHENVVAFPAVAEPPREVKSEPRRFRWVGGLVAASVAVLAITVGVQVTGGGSGSGDIVAGEAAKAVPTGAAPNAPSPLAAAPFSASTPETTAAPGLLSSFSAADSAVESAPSSATPAGGASPSAIARSVPSPSAEQPAKLVVDSNTQYTQAGLSGQVTTLLDRLGVHSAREAEQMPPQKTAMPVEDGFTSSWASLRDCLSWLAKSPRAQALVVDRGTFEGAAAGVIVVPADDVDAAVTPPPTATVESSMGTMDVWVVDPSCRHQVDSILEYLPYAWSR
jgi:hypothetical protein